MNQFTLPLVGGVALGLASIWLLWSLGRIAGISGILWGAAAGPERHWRWAFLVGLLGGGAPEDPADASDSAQRP